MRSWLWRFFAVLVFAGLAAGCGGTSSKIAEGPKDKPQKPESPPPVPPPPKDAKP
jgi:hypothetical protein